jgi:hypothetical protein
MLLQGVPEVQYNALCRRHQLSVGVSGDKAAQICADGQFIPRFTIAMLRVLDACSIGVLLTNIPGQILWTMLRYDMVDSWMGRSAIGTTDSQRRLEMWQHEHPPRIGGPVGPVMYRATE